MIEMHLWNTPMARMRAVLVATIALGALLFVVTTTQATSANGAAPWRQRGSEGRGSRRSDDPRGPTRPDRADL